MNAKKFEKISLLFKVTKTKDFNLPVTEVRDFFDCGLVITGDYLIIISDDNTTSTGNIFPLSEIITYKTKTNI